MVFPIVVHVLEEEFLSMDSKKRTPPFLHSSPNLGPCCCNSAWRISNKHCSVPQRWPAGSLDLVQSCFTACLLGIQQFPAKLFTLFCGQETGCLWHVKWNSISPSDINKLSGLVSFRNRAFDNVIIFSWTVLSIPKEGIGKAKARSSSCNRSALPNPRPI